MAETRQQEYVGTIRKCPNCGQVLQSFQAKCPACGHELTGVGVASSVKEFFDFYQKETDKFRQLELIKSFPVPNSKEDILEFALLASQQIKSLANLQASRINMNNLIQSPFDEQGGIIGVYKTIFTGNENITKVKQEDFYIAWKDKLEQIQLKAGLVFGEDRKGFEQLSIIILEAIEAVNNLEKKKEKTKRNYRIQLVACFIGVIAFIAVLPKLGTVMVNNFNSSEAQMQTPEKIETARLEALMSEIRTDISSGDYDSAELKLADLIWKYGSANYHQKDIDSWETKRKLLQKQLDSKRNGGQ